MARKSVADQDGPKRVQMDMPEKSFIRLKQLQEMTEASSYAEVVKNALRLYEALLEEHEAGGEIILKRGNESKKLTIFAA